MDAQQKSLLAEASGNVDECLQILNLRATHGAKAKPTVAELNEILDRLASARDAIEQATEG